MNQKILKIALAPIVLFISFCFMESAKSVGNETFRKASAICKVVVSAKLYEVPLASKGVCRSRPEHKKILNWKCSSKKGSLQKISFKEPC